jgi:hypothetical protein
MKAEVVILFPRENLAIHRLCLYSRLVDIVPLLH